MNCILCQLPLRLRWGVCSQCLKHLPRLKNECEHCGLPLLHHNKRCENCLVFRPYWDRLIAFSGYQRPFNQLIYQFKSNQKTELALALARLMFLAWYQKRQINSLMRPDIVTCVPLYKSRYWSRGYNQSALLAKPIAHWMAAKYNPYLLKRSDKRKDQKMLSKYQRYQNVQDIFQCKADLNGKSILVVDDIVTTGYTVNEISKQLKSQGALSIQILCLCRTSL